MDTTIDQAQRQSVLDAVVPVQSLRGRALEELGAGRTMADARVAVSGRDVGPWLMKQFREKYRHVLSVRSWSSGARLARSMPTNRECIERGLQMTSIFDFDRTDASARALLEAEPPGTYRYGFAPLDMRIVDHREVLLHGPVRTGEMAILSLTSPTALGAARRYWDAVMATSVPCAAARGDLGDLTDRQRSILALLRDDTPDPRIAAALGVSVRTVHYDLAAAMKTFGVHSRFALGAVYSDLADAEAAAPADPTD